MAKGLSTTVWRARVDELRTFLMTHDLENELESLKVISTHPTTR